MGLRKPRRLKEHFGLLAMLVLVIASLTLPSVAATFVYAGWVVSEQSFTAEGMNFTAVYAGGNRATLTGPEGRYVLDAGQCRKTETYEYCLNEIDHEDHASYKGGKEFPGLSITINKLEAAITVERSATPTQIDLGGRAEITVTLKNTGDKPALNFHYADNFPAGVKVVSVNNAANLGDHVEYNSVMSEGKTAQLKYTIEFKQYVDFTTKATATWGENNEGYAESDTTHFSVNKPFRIAKKLKPEKVELNVPMSYTLTLQSMTKRELTVSKLEMHVPKGLTVTSASKNLKKTNQSYVFAGSVREDEEFQINFKVPKEGQYDIQTDMDIISEGKEFTDSVEMPIRIGVSRILPEIELPSEVKENQKFHVKATLKNIGDEPIANITVRTKGKLITAFEQNKIKIADLSEYAVVDKDMVAAQVDKPTAYTLLMEGEYLGETGKVLRFSAERSVMVQPQPDALALRTVTGKTSIAKGSTMEVHVFVRNLLGYILRDVKVADLFPKKIDIPKGKPTIDIDSLNPGTEIEAYNYTLQVLPGYSDPTLSIKTIANARTKEGDFKTEKTTEIAVGRDIINEAMDQGRGQNETVQETLGEDETTGPGTLGTTNQSSGEETQDTQQNTDGVLARFWGWLKGLFSSGETKE